MEIKIEKGLPIPEKRAGVFGSIANALKTMAIGDSFECTEAQRKNAQQTCHQFHIKVVTRKVAKDVYRVWRIA